MLHTSLVNTVILMKSSLFSHRELILYSVLPVSSLWLKHPSLRTSMAIDGHVV